MQTPKTPLRPLNMGYLNTEALGLFEDLNNCGGYRYAILSDRHNIPTTVKMLLWELFMVLFKFIHSEWSKVNSGNV